MGKRRCGCGVCKVVGGNIDGLNGGYGAVSRRGDTLLQCAHLGCQRGLVADGGRHTAEQCGDLRACLRKSEDIIDKQQNILAGLVTEVLCDGKAGQRHTKSCSGRLVHLAEHECGLIDNARLCHLMPKVVALTAAFADTGENGVAAVLVSDIADKLLDKNGLADTCAAEKADLATLGVRRKQIDDLDARFEYLGRGSDLGKLGSETVDGHIVLCIDGSLTVDGLADNIEHAAERAFTNGHLDGRAGVNGTAATGDTVGGKQ